MQFDRGLIEELIARLGDSKHLKLTSSNGQVLTISIAPDPTIKPPEQLEHFSSEASFIEEPNSDSNPSHPESDGILEILSGLQIKSTHSGEESVPTSLNSGHRSSLETNGQPDPMPSPLKEKKFFLSNKQNKKANQVVLNFMSSTEEIPIDCLEIQPIKKISEEENQQFTSVKDLDSIDIKTRTKDDGTKDEDSKQNYSKDERISGVNGTNGINGIDAREIQTLALINQRLLQLEQVSKEKLKLEEEIGQILESTHTSFKSDSHDIQSQNMSILSLQSSSSEDPLCKIFAQYLKRTQEKTSMKLPFTPSFLFMYSQPMIDQKGKQICQLIDYFEEESIIHKTLKEGKCHIDYIREPATINRFHYWIRQGVEILHFCGHGVKSTENYLLFENQIAESVRLSTDKLRQILDQMKTRLKLVFVASCHSQSAGQVFLAAGALHVICILDAYQISDQACKQFVKIFYLSCINEKMTVCEAFSFAKKQLALSGKFTHHECQKFMLLKQHSNCTISFEEKSVKSDFTDLTMRPYYAKNMPSKVQNYVARARDLHEIVKLMNEKKRFVSITGEPGMGKSTLVRELVRYVQFRTIFKDGVIYLQLRDCESIRKLFEALDIEIFETNRLKLNKSTQTNIQSILSELGDRHVLLVFDNCQSLVASEDAKEFKQMVEAILKNCMNVYFIFTNRHSITRQLDYCSEMLYQLQKLSDSQTRELFFKHAPRNFRKEEIEAFSTVESNISSIAKHPFFQFLNGHPEAVCLTASLLSERSLSEVYELLLQPSLSHELQGKKSQYGRDQGVNEVVETAMKISLNVLKNKHTQASQMIKILSFLPNGLDSQLMSRLFGAGNKWKGTVQKLISHNLVLIYEKAGSKYYAVHPHIIVHVDKEIGNDEKIKLQERICVQLVKRLDKIYRNVGTSSVNSQRAQEMFLIEQQNYKAVILRELSFFGDKKEIKELYFNLFQNHLCFEDEQDEKLDEKPSQRKPISKQEAITTETGFKRPLRNEKISQSAKKEPIDLIIVYYVTVLFVMHRTKTALVDQYITYGITLAQKRNKLLLLANLNRIRGCLYLSNSRITEARKYFMSAWVDFAYEGCGLGAASCEAAVGYIRFLQEQYASAKMNLESALKYYDEIPHAFGKHYLNRWLLSLKSKMNRGENELSSHKAESLKLLKQAKLNLKSSNIHNTSLIRHKMGVFVFRFFFDNISLFLEASFEVDIRSKMININQGKKNEEKMERMNEENNILFQITQEGVMPQQPSYNLVAKRQTLQSKPIFKTLNSKKFSYS